MLTSDQERSLERFSLECRGYRVQVTELRNGIVKLKCGKEVRFVHLDGKTIGPGPRWTS